MTIKSLVNPFFGLKFFIMIGAATQLLLLFSLQIILVNFSNNTKALNINIKINPRNSPKRKHKFPTRDRKSFKSIIQQIEILDKKNHKKKRYIDIYHLP